MNEPIDFARPVSNGAASPSDDDRPWPDNEVEPYSMYKAGERGREAASVKILDAASIWAPRPPVQYAVAGVLPLGSVAMMVATGSSLKTWATLDLIVARAKGAKWLGRFACEPGPALFVDWESGEDEVCRRLQRLSPDPVPGVALVTMPELFFNSDTFEQSVEQWSKSYGLIVFDSLAAGTVDVDENDARFAQGLRTLKRVAAVTRGVFMVLHHSRKGKPGEDAGDERDMPRGTSANFAACDVVFQLTRAKDEATFQVRQTKARGGKCVTPFLLRVDDPTPDVTVVLASELADAEDGAAARFTEVKAKVVRLLASDRDCRSASEIHRRVKGTKKTVLDAVKELEERGTLTKLNGIYRLSSEMEDA